MIDTMSSFLTLHRNFAFEHIYTIKIMESVGVCMGVCVCVCPAMRFVML